MRIFLICLLLISPFLIPGCQPRGTPVDQTGEAEIRLIGEGEGFKIYRFKDALGDVKTLIVKGDSIFVPRH